MITPPATGPRASDASNAPTPVDFAAPTLGASDAFAAAVASSPAVRAFRNWQEQSRLLERLQVVFLFGPPKCGTTWVQRLMNAHPNVIAAGESHLADSLLVRLQQAVAAHNQAQTGMKRSTKPGKQAEHLLVSNLDLTLLARQALDRVLIGYIRADAASGTRDPSRPLLAVMDKTPGTGPFIDALHALYPWARFVCITRDVRDAAVSAYFHRQLLGELGSFTSPDQFAPAFASDVWGPAMLHARLAARRLPNAHYAETSYEALKDRPEQELARLLGILGLPADKATVRTCVERSDFRSLTGREPGQEAANYFRKGVVGDWRNHLSESAAAQAQHIGEMFLSKAATSSAIGVAAA
mgnify:CR=1 FL=1